MNGNVYFHDSRGNTTFGTIRNGNVFLNTSNGEVTFGTIKNGNVFLTDQKGTTTGTIRNGNIFLSNSDGSITTGSYDHSGNVNTSTSGSTSSTVHSQQDDEWKRQQEQNYEAGTAFGRGLGSAISAMSRIHRINSFCKTDPTATYHSSNGLATPCPNATMDQWEQTRINEYCADNPGSWTAFGRHRVDCLTPPNPPNLKWAKWELKVWHWYAANPKKANLGLSAEQMSSNWSYWQAVYGGLASGASYKALNGKKERCN
jgi:hypothetical protein